MVFLKIGEIDTLKEFYQADAFLQIKWREPKLDGKTPEVIECLSLIKTIHATQPERNDNINGQIIMLIHPETVASVHWRF